MFKNLLFTALILLTLGFTGTLLAQDDTGSDQPYDATPKHAWELGLNGGLAFITGDVDWRPSFGVGLHLRRATDHIFSIRIEGQYYSLLGLEKDHSRNADADLISELNALGYGNDSPGDADWYPNYKTTMLTASVQGIMSFNQFKFIRNIRHLNLYAFAGAGGTSFNVKADALNNGAKYQFTSPPDASDLDGDYETELVLRSDDLNSNYLSPILDMGVGIAYRFSRRFNLGLEYKGTFIFGRADDFMDGHYNRTHVDETNNRDILNYVNLRLNINLGNLDEISEPLWWTNPMGFMLNDIAELKARPVLDLTDTDGDGVIDMLDQEPETPEGFAVDTRGVSLDSDGDGIVDGEDDEPYSPIGYEIDMNGVAQIPAPDLLDEADVNRILDDRLKNFKGGSLSDWFLPMIHFDFNKSNIKRSEYEKLHHVATVMQLNPDIRVVVSGHTDKTSSNCYNNKLSYQRSQNAINHLIETYGISRNRLVLNWSGEENVIIPTEARNYINRRVEFRVAKAESDQGMPDCSGPSPSGYSGNKEAGY